ncbi:hypothetical protein AN478_10800 [Thiohalorhabdus denitrificans]|uniref:PilZ domain-containing protein n=1 Tax=Thiohalorhabdus denitrificans TaxID=381306 RepID=A0A0P9EBG4_9GAMM|nr:hypothetical protein [Thiohalorhabdus denitrificans]KPV39611.1 hypothetical protein AN478_10800 [Thiohalorhabdus denitrificans]SCX96831.1 hypothetical protein SAMN05661077_0874 [Thiohalorhabdus denitrificans]
MQEQPPAAGVLAARLRTLVGAARNGGVRGEAVEYLARTSAYVAGMLDLEPDGAPVPKADEPGRPVTGPGDLQACLSHLIVRAEAAGVEPAVTGYLRRVLLRVSLAAERVPWELRLVPRHRAVGEARLVIPGESPLPVGLLDHSALGYGLECPGPVASGRVGRLELPAPGSGPPQVYGCLPVYCREEPGGGCRVGVELIDRSALP